MILEILSSVGIFLPVAALISITCGLAGAIHGDLLGFTYSFFLWAGVCFAGLLFLMWAVFGGYIFLEWAGSIPSDSISDGVPIATVGDNTMSVPWHVWILGCMLVGTILSVLYSIASRRNDG